MEYKFLVEPPCFEETKVCMNGYGHMTKMDALPIYGKSPLEIFFSGTKKQGIVKLVVKDLRAKL